MAILCKKTKKGISLALKGDLGFEEANSLLAYLKDHVDRPLTVDMSETESVDTSIIQLILAAKEAARKRGAALRLINPHELVMRVLFQAGFGAEISIN